MTIIKRTALHFEDQYTPIPRSWARDDRVSRRARGLLVELVSHRSGWKISLRSLATQHEGRDAVATAMRELIDAGYLVRSQPNDAGRFGEVEYEIRDPHTDTASGFAGSGSTASGQTASGSSAPIRKQGNKETRKEGNNPQTPTGGMEIALATRSLVESEDLFAAAFQSFYTAYPRKVGKEAARKAYAKAARRAGGFADINEGARRFAADPNLPTDRQFIPYPATWLNRDGWEDEPLPPRADARRTAVEIMADRARHMQGGGDPRELSA